jgi:hypothetical protein
MKLSDYYTIQVMPDLPRRQLSERVCEVLAPEFIAEMNAWLLQFFGTYNLIDDGVTCVIEAGRTIYMNPRTHAQLKAEGYV